MARIDIGLWPHYLLEARQANVVAYALSCNYVPSL
jgi:hypothetical protein